MATADDILFGEAGPRTQGADHRIEDIWYQLSQLDETEPDPALVHIPPEFFDALEGGLPSDDPRSAQMIEIVSRSICNTSTTMQGETVIKAAHQLLAFGPAIAYGDEQDLDPAVYARLVNKLMYHKLAYVNPERDQLDARIEQLFTVLNLKPARMPKQVAYRDTKHLLTIGGKKTLCGKKVGNGWVRLDRHADDIDAPNKLYQVDCQHCRISARTNMATDRLGYIPLSKKEQEDYVANQVLRQVPERVRDALSDKQKRSPEDISQMIEQQVWSVSVASLRLKEPLDGASIARLSKLEPGEPII